MIWQEWFRDQFLSTPSARRATIPAAIVFLGDLISIHALREEGDSVSSATRMRSWYFYPRPPRGGRQECQEEQ